MLRFSACRWSLFFTALLGIAHVAAGPRAALAREPGAVKPALDNAAHWIDSDNGALSLRAYVKEPAIGADESIVLVAEIRNNQARPITILRPFGDPYLAQGAQIKIWNDTERIKYTGPKADYDLTGEAFTTLAAGASVTGTLDLPPRHFAASAKAGGYTVRYDYAYSGDWDQKVAAEGFKDIWRRALCSREIRIERR
jgi:hypothetical protein